jgi:hypothetical protein
MAILLTTPDNLFPLLYQIQLAKMPTFVSSIIIAFFTEDYHKTIP